MNPIDSHDLANLSELVILSGRTLLECGASTSRVEDTMVRVGYACGFDDVRVLANPTGVYITLVSGEHVTTRVDRVSVRSTDLGKIAYINDLSRRLDDGEVSAARALAELREIHSLQPCYSAAWTFVARALTSGCWALLLGGALCDLLPAMIAGFLVQAVVSRMSKFAPDFLGIFFGALLGTGWAVLAVNAGFGAHLSAVVVGVTVPLVPGVALTNAVRDLISGHLVSGVARGAEALLMAVAIAAGVSTILSTVTWMR